MSLREGVIRVVAGVTKQISYYHNAERIVARSNHLSWGRKFFIYLFYGVLALFSARCLLKGASLLADEPYLLERIDFMMYLFESLGLNMGYFFQLICGIWLYSFVVYFLNLHHPDADVWRHVYDLTCYNLNLFKAAVDYSVDNAQLVKILRRDKRRRGGSGASGGSGGDPLDHIPLLTYYKVLPIEVRVKLLKWLVLSESFMFAFIWGALLIVFLSFIRTVEKLPEFAWLSFLANVFDLISYFFMLIMLIQVSYICLFNNMLICYATVKEIAQLNLILSMQNPEQQQQQQQQMGAGPSSSLPLFPPGGPLPPSKAAKAVGLRVGFVFRYHTAIVAFLNHYNRLYSKIIVFFMAGNVPSNCYVICYLLYATNHSTITKLCLLLVVEFQFLQLLGILLPVVYLNAAITSPSKWLYRLQMKLMNVTLGGGGGGGGAKEGRGPFRWSLKFKVSGYYELVTGRNAFMGITVPWFGRVKQWTVLEFVMMYAAYILKFTETFMKKK